jgi:hypothetical protein
VLTILGLSLVVIAWIEQLWRSLIRGRLTFSPFFLAVFLIGMAIMAYDNFRQAFYVEGSLEAAVVLLAFIILIILIVRRGKPGAF